MHYLCMFALMLNVGILSCNIYGVVAMQIYQVSLFVECERQMIKHCLCRRYMHKIMKFILYLYFQVRNGHIKRITDNDIQSLVLEIVGTNVRYVNILNVFNLPSKWHNSCIFLSMIWYKHNVHLASLLLQHNIHHMSSRSKENTWY